jgi:Uma2 family endonuclease
MEIAAAATHTEAQTEPRARAGLVPYRLTVEKFLRMIDLGFFPDKPEVELVGGLLVERMTRHRPHSFSVGKLDDLFHDILPKIWHVQAENPVVLDTISRPEPDIAVIRGNRDDYRDRDPVAADVGLIVEASESTYRKDRNAMWRLYAAAEIPTYWIVNLAARRVEVYSDPVGKGKTAEYRICRIYAEDQAIPVELEGVENRSIRVRDVLP